jgi:S1-C subfamily serine protease
VVTNAHVLWPFDEADLLFSDGSEHLSVPIVGWDLVADLAVLGPVDTDATPAPFSRKEDAGIGSEVYLIGYAGGQESSPAFGRGFITRIREWPAAQLSYYQTDLSVIAGQSGGVLVSITGELVGIVTHVITEDDFALATTAKDVLARVNDLIAGGSVAVVGRGASASKWGCPGARR